MFVIRTVQVALDKVHKGIQLTIILGVLNLPVEETCLLCILIGSLVKSV
jgi:hypothetical protein